MVSSMEGWTRGETGARVQGGQRGEPLGGAGRRNLRLFLQSHQVYQTLPFAPGRKSKRQAGKAFREQDLPVSGGSRCWVPCGVPTDVFMATGAPDSSLVLPVDLTLLRMCRMQEGGFVPSAQALQ